MKFTTVALLIVCAIPVLGSDPVDIGSLDYKGKTYSNAKASLVTPNAVRISSRTGHLTITWDELNPSAQFRLKPEREKMIARAEAEFAERAKSRETWLVRGTVAAVFPDGCAIHCDVPQSRVAHQVDHLARVGAFIGEPNPMRRDVEDKATGMVFVRGLKGLADHESVDIRAVKTSDTKTIWETETLRVYDLAQ